MLDADKLLGAPADERVAFSTLIESLRLAESAAKQLAFMRGQKKWLTVEFALGAVRERVTAMALKN